MGVPRQHPLNNKAGGSGGSIFPNCQPPLKELTPPPRLLIISSSRRRAAAAVPMKRRSRRRSLSMKSCRRNSQYHRSRSSSGGSTSTTADSILRRVRALKKLIPQNRQEESDSESGEGLDGLFSDTANYIMSLQMRVRIMQIMLDQFTTTTDGCCSSSPTD